MSKTLVQPIGKKRNMESTSKSLATRIKSSRGAPAFSIRLQTNMLKLQSLFVLLLLLFFPQFLKAEVATASIYNPPYTPTQCYGDNAWKFPTNDLFAAAGEGIWDNGAACGRQYLVKCVGAAVPNTCIPGQTIQVTIVDQAQTSVSRPARGGVAIVLSKTAFGTIANPPATFMIIDIQPV